MENEEFDKCYFKYEVIDVRMVKKLETIISHIFGGHYE